MRVTIFFAILLGVMPVQSHAQTVADNMTCQQAVRNYEQNGRIYKLAGRQAIPIYDGVTASRRGELKCSPVGVFVKTADNPRCPVAYKCYPRSTDGGR